MKTALIISASVIAVAAIAAYIILRLVLYVVIASNKPSYAKGNSGFMNRINKALSQYKDVREAARERLHKREIEKVYIKSRDGLTLCGHWLQAENPKRTIVMMHGFRSSWDKDFCCAVEFFTELGSNLLIVDQRARGESEGKYIAYGMLERYDCVEWMKYADNRCGGKLPLYADGMSMGAATVMLASELDLPESTAGIIADCGYTSPAEILTHYINKSRNIPEKPLIPILSALCKTVAGFGFYDRSTIDALANSTHPILFVHGENDLFVPCEMSIRNYEAAKGPKELVIIPGAGHGHSYLVDTETCQKGLASFFDKCENGGF